MSAKETKPSSKKPGKEETNAVALFVDGGDKLPDYMRQDGVGRGNEAVDHSDLVIPRLEVVQALSPCRQKNKPEFIEGAEEGMLYNNVSRRLYAGAVMIVPVVFRKEYQLWLDRKKSGGQQGFRGAFATEQEARARKEELPAAEYEITDIIEAHVHFCLLADPATGTVEEICLSMSRSKKKVSKRWNSMIRMFGGDRFSRAYKLVAVEESGQQGDYYNFAVAAAGFPSAVLYQRAEKLYEDIGAGLREISRDEEVDITDIDSDEM